MRKSLVLFAFSTLGCHGETSLTAMDVTVYSAEGSQLERPPERYEIVREIEVSAATEVSGNSIPEEILELARTKAAGLGANGVIVETISTVGMDSIVDGAPPHRDHVKTPITLKGKAIRTARVQ